MIKVRKNYNRKVQGSTLKVAKEENMKLSDKIEGYESLSAEEKLKALEELDIEDDSKLKNLLQKANSEASEWKKKLKEKEDELNSKLSEDERNEKERKEKEAEREALLENLLKEKTVAEHKANFLQRGYDEDLATSSATALANGDFTTLFDNLGKFISERDKKAKVEALDGMKRPLSGGTTPEVTKEQFNKMSLSERTKLFETNKELYDSYTKGD